MDRRQRVIIRDEVKRLATLLPFDGGLHHSEVIAKVRHASRFDAGENARCGQGERAGTLRDLPRACQARRPRATLPRPMLRSFVLAVLLLATFGSQPASALEIREKRWGFDG